MSLPSLNDLPAPPPGKIGWPWTEQSDPMPDTQPGGSPWPKISIVTPSYNQGQFIEETIRSVLLQGYPNLEYIVMDGGSDDETIRILEKYDPWIDHWVSEPDEGQSDAINKGFEQATGKLFGWLNSDDYYAIQALRATADAFAKADDDVGAIVGTGHKVNTGGEIVYTPDVPELSREAFLDWMDYGHFMQPACFFTREAWEQCGPLRTDLRYPMDVDLWLKMSAAFKFERLDKSIAYAYVHEQAKTTAEIPRMRAETSLLVAQHGGWSIAHKHLMRQADALVEARGRLRMITNHPVYRLIRPFYKWFTRR